jgi:uncharacterized damage-inducible protein DinB
MDLLDRLLEHDRWGTSQLLEKCATLTDAQLDQEFDIGHRTLRVTIDHIISNIEGWTALMVRIPPPEQPDNLSVAMQAERHERAYAAFADLARRIVDEDRMEEMFADFYGEQQTFGAAILQVILHNEGHRNEAVHILTRLGLPGETLEFDHGLWDIVRRGVAFA